MHPTGRTLEFLRILLITLFCLVLASLTDSNNREYQTLNNKDYKIPRERDKYFTIPNPSPASTPTTEETYYHHDIRKFNNGTWVLTRNLNRWDEVMQLGTKLKVTLQKSEWERWAQMGGLDDNKWSYWIFQNLYFL